jgi:hypothetical protein
MEHLIRSIDRIVDRKRQLTPPPVHERPQPLQTRVEQRTGTPNPALLANLKTIASEFFGAPAKSVSVAGRNHAQLVKLDGNRGWLCGIADPNPEDVAEFAQFLNPPERGFFIYDGGLSPSTSMALDRLRVEGKSIIPIGLNAMSAAIADGNTSVLLADLQRAYESNLFDTRNAIIDERFFFGRSELLNKVGSALARGEHVLVSGLRKCGKTSFLNILRRHLLSHPVCIVDLQRYDRHTEDWPSALFGLIIKSYDQWGFRTFRDWPGKTNKSSAPTTATQLEDSLSIRRAWQRDRGRQEPLILILDEAERIFPADDEIEPARKYTRAAGALRMVGQSSSDRPLAIIAADLRPWLNRKNILADGSTNPFFHFFLEVPLPLLSQFAVGELVRVIGSASGITRVESAYVDELYTLSGGHPSITRMIAGASHKARQKSNELTLADLHAGLDEMAGSDVLGAFFRANLWGLMTNEEKASLRGVADGSIFKWLRAKVGFATRSPRQPPYPEAAANLSDQGILRDGKIAIGSFDEWLRGLPT